MIDFNLIIAGVIVALALFVCVLQKAVMRKQKELIGKYAQLVKEQNDSIELANKVILEICDINNVTLTSIVIDCPESEEKKNAE